MLTYAKMLLDQLQLDLTSAVKSRDQVRVDTLRFLLGGIFNFQIAKGKDYMATDSDVLTIISKQVKTHKESIEMFTKGGRDDLVKREKAELEILGGYLPQQIGEQEIREKIEKIKKDNPQADFGMLMKLAMGELKGKADGNIIARLVREL